MHLLVVLKGKPDLSTSFSAFAFPIGYLFRFIGRGFIGISRCRFGRRAIHILPEFFRIEIRFHVISPLTPVGVSETLEGALVVGRHC